MNVLLSSMTQARASTRVEKPEPNSIYEVIIEYQMLPLFLGRHDLPKLHIVDRSANPDALQLQVKKLNDPAYLASLKEQNQRVEYLIKGYTLKVLILDN